MKYFTIFTFNHFISLLFKINIKFFLLNLNFIFHIANWLIDFISINSILLFKNLILV